MINRLSRQIIIKLKTPFSASFTFSTSASLNALSPLDGRYSKSASELAAYFSEAALMKYRVKV